MKTLHLTIITIVFAGMFVGATNGFAQVAPHAAFQIVSFKGNHGTYDIPYNIVNGTVVGTPLDLAAKALLFEINTTSNGQLTVELPRAIIDSKNGSKDVPYFVSIDNIRSLGGPIKIVPEEINGSEMRILKINFQQDITEIEIVGTFFVEKFHYAPANLLTKLLPLKQYESGIAAKDVHCKEGFQLIIKTEDGTPACVKPVSANKLIALGWAVEDFGHSNGVRPFDTLKMNVIGTDFLFNYTILGGQLENATANIQNQSLDLSLKTTENGTLIVILPRGLIDPKIHGQDSPFIIVEDGREVKYKQADSTITDRMLIIPFQYGVTKIEIIAPEPIR